MPAPKVHAFEAEYTYDATYAGRGDVNLHHFAVWTKNETLPWGHMATKKKTRSGFVLDGPRRRLGAAHALELDADRPTRRGIDVADFLKRTVSEDDFVVVKMDIEGAEYDVIPHLIAAGAAPTSAAASQKSPKPASVRSRVAASPIRSGLTAGAARSVSRTTFKSSLSHSTEPPRAGQAG